MRKFLKLIDENRPGSNSQYVISIKGPAEFEDIQVSGDEYVYHLYRKIKDYVDGVEDNEMTVDDESVKEAGKVLKAAEEITGISNPRRRLTGIGNPKKNVEKAVGDMYNKVAKKVKEFSK